MEFEEEIETLEDALIFRFEGMQATDQERLLRSIIADIAMLRASEMGDQEVAFLKAVKAEKINQYSTQTLTDLRSEIKIDVKKSRLGKATKHWINNDQVDALLSGDGYENVSLSDAAVGDGVIYRDSNGRVVHSATVSAIDSETGQITVEGLGGLETEPSQDPIHNPDPGLGAATVEIWRGKDDK